MKKFYVIITGIMSIMFLTATASAHVTVKPSDVPTSTYQPFSVSVPNEKEIPTVSVKLVVPESVLSVTPTVKPGWTIATEKSGTGEDSKVVSITWSGGSIGEGLRDDFGFTGKTPDKAGEIKWKAYQTYSDGTVVAWDKESRGDDHGQEDPNSGPLSVTKVATTAGTPETDNQSTTTSDIVARSVSVISLGVSLLVFAIATKKHSTKK